MKQSLNLSLPLPVGTGRLFQRVLGGLLFVVGTIMLATHGFAWLDLGPPLLHALQAGAFCALGTALGAVPVLVVRNLPAALADTLLGFGAGVMLAATAFSLVIPGFEAARSLGFALWAASGVISAGLLFGALCLLLVDLKVSATTPEAIVGTQGQPVIAARIWLFVIAIIGHNIPEGMAIGVSAGGGMADTDSLTLGIALQNVPEGLVVALVLAGTGMSRFKAFLVGAASGLVEPLAAVVCAWLVNIAELLLPLGLACAAGAMLLVVTQEVIPESRSNGHHRLASIGLCVGFCMMMVMDTAIS